MTCGPWLTEDDLIACGCPNGADPVVIERAISLATGIMYRLSGRRFPGICSATVIPCGCSGPSVTYGYSTSPWYPHRSGGQWTNTSCGCSRGVGCDGFVQVTLGTWRLVAVDAVRIGGETLPADAYEVHEGRYLVRTDGGVWPCCSRDWQVDFRYGRRPPRDGVIAAAQYATELVKACMPGQKCALPERVQTIIRDGQTMVMLDPFEFLENGRLGLLGPDQWLQSVNPERLQRRARAWAPGMGGKVRRIG